MEPRTDEQRLAVESTASSVVSFRSRSQSSNPSESSSFLGTSRAKYKQKTLRANSKLQRR